MLKCDCCGQFGDLEEITIVIKKHPSCDVNTLFGKAPTSPQAVLAPKPVVLGNQFTSIPPVITEDMPPIDYQAQAIAEKLKAEGKLP